MFLSHFNEEFAIYSIPVWILVFSSLSWFPFFAYILTALWPSFWTDLSILFSNDFTRETLIIWNLYRNLRRLNRFSEPPQIMSLSWMPVTVLWKVRRKQRSWSLAGYQGGILIRGQRIIRVITESPIVGE